MEYLIVALFFLAVWHFIYQAILLPSIHVKQRNRLFALRDRLRSYHFQESARKHAHAFAVAQDGINNAIDSVELLSVSLQARASHRYATDEAFKKRVRSRVDTIKHSGCAEIKDISHQANDVLRDILVYNAGGWFIYIVPIALICVFYERIEKTTKKLFALTPADANSILGSNRNLAVAAC